MRQRDAPLLGALADVLGVDMPAEPLLLDPPVLLSLPVDGVGGVDGVVVAGGAGVAAGGDVGDGALDGEASLRLQPATAAAATRARIERRFSA